MKKKRTTPSDFRERYRIDFKRLKTRGKKEVVRISIDIDYDVLQIIDSESNFLSMSRSALIKYLITDALTRREKDKKEEYNIFLSKQET